VPLVPLVAQTPPYLQLSWISALVIAAGCAVAGLLVHLVRRRRSAVVSRALVETSIVVGLFGMWQIVRVFAVTKVAGGIANGEAVLRFERALRLPNETWLQRMTLPHPTLVQAANLYYLYLHFTGITVFLVWLFLRHREAYAKWRTTLVLVTAACLAVQFVPVAPPRFLVQYGFVDTAVRYGESVYGRMNTGIADQLSAMPSVHFAWAALIGLAVVTVSTSRLRWLVLAHPALTLYAIVVTANHFWLDAVAAAALLGLALALQALFARGWLRLRLLTPLRQRADVGPVRQPETVEV
jgi:PAP2 superfamily